MQQFQRPEYITLDAAPAALDTITKHAAPGVTPEQKARIEADLQKKRANDPLRRFTDLLRSAEPLSTEDAAFVEHFKQTPEGRAVIRLREKLNNRAV